MMLMIERLHQKEAYLVVFLLVEVYLEVILLVEVVYLEIQVQQLNQLEDCSEILEEVGVYLETKMEMGHHFSQTQQIMEQTFLVGNKIL